MNKKIFFLCLLSFSLLLLVPGKSNMLTGHSIQQDERLKLGYCPTMNDDAELIKAMNPEVELIEYRSASEVLAHLNSKDIDLALIGRKAKTDELNNCFERMLKSGYTLIAPSKQFIYYNDLIKLKESATWRDEEAREVERARSDCASRRRRWRRRGRLGARSSRSLYSMID